VLSKDYAVAPLAPTILTGLYEVAGVRIMRRAHWEALLRDFAPGATDVDIRPELDPGADDALSSGWMVPTGSYWHQVDRFARQTAAAVVATELADTATAATRRVLTLLPDGSGAAADATTVGEQIRALWKRVTGEELSVASQTYADFQTLWTAAEPSGSDDDARRAWRTVLVALLSHPSVIGY
jgi:hypothetical protein